MNEKERKQKRKTVEIEQEAIREIDHETRHPGQDEASLQQAAFDPGENDFLNMYTGDSLEK